MNNAEILNLLRLTRAYCAEKMVWFAPALFGVRIVLTEKIPVAAIDGNMNIYFNPECVAKIRENSPNLADFVAQMGFIWIHEIAHVLREHRGRAEDQKANPQLWNIAADFEINDGNWEGLKMPELFPGLLPPQYNLPEGKLAEWYYHEMLNNPELTASILESLGDIWDEGSGVHGQSRDWEIGEDRQQLHPLDIEIMRRETARKMFENRKFIGKLPGSWDIWVEKVQASRTDWRKKLRHRMSIAISTGTGLRVDYSFARPNRRQAVYFPIVAPSFSGDMSARIACVVDTSGSMGPDEIGQAVGEVCRVLDVFKIPITVIPCDAQAYEPIVLSKPSDWVKLEKLPGGGGTDMIVGIQAALALRPSPDTVLVLTDGYTDYPSVPYKIPVVFGILKRDFGEQTPLPSMPPWSSESVVDILLNE